MKKNPWKNERGSVLTVAIALIALLSFAVTTVTAHTYSNAEQTSRTLEGRLERIQDETHINMAIEKFNDSLMEKYAEYEEDFIATGNGTIEGFFAWFEDDDPPPSYFEEISGAIYAKHAVNVSIRSADDDLARTYRFSRTHDDGSVLRRDFFISFHGSEGVPLEDTTEYIENTDEALADMISEENTITADDFEDHDSTEVDSTTGVTINEDMYVEGDLNFAEILNNPETTFELNGSFLVVDGDFIISDGEESTNQNTSVRKIHSPEDEPSVILVRGNLYVNQNFNMSIENVYFLVEGYVDMQFTHNNADHRQLYGTNFAIYSFENHVDSHDERLWDTLIGRLDDEAGYDPLAGPYTTAGRYHYPTIHGDSYHVHKQSEGNTLYTYIGDVPHDDEDRVTLEDIYMTVSPGAQTTLDSNVSAFSSEEDEED